MPIDNLSKITSRSGINTTILLEAGNANVTGVVTATSFVGALTGEASQVTIANGADNRVITAASANTLNSEENFTYNGTKVDLTGSIDSTVAGGDNNLIVETTSSGDPSLSLNAAGSGGHTIEYIRSSNALNFKQGGGSVRLSITSAGHLLPGTDNQYNIGEGTTNFASIWASTRFRGNDNVKLVLGASQNLSIRHDGNENIIGSPVGDNLHIKSGTGDVDSQYIASFIHSSGNVGIGSTTPNAKFVVSNAGINGFEFNPNFNSNNSIIASYNRSSDAYSQLTLSASQHIFSRGGVEYGRFDANGDLGIGTDSISQPLTIRRSSTDQAEFGVRLEYQNLTGPTATSSAMLVNGNGLQFRNYNSNRTFIFNNGNVGIGSLDPSAKLDIAGGLSIKDSNALYKFEIAANSNEAEIKSRASSGAYRNTVFLTNNFVVKNTGTNSPQESLRILSDGRMGINTTTVFDTNTMLQVTGKTGAGPNLVLHRNDTSVAVNQVLGALRITGNDSDGTQQESSAIEFVADLDHGTGDKPGRISFKTTNDGASSATEKLRITSDGHVRPGGDVNQDLGANTSYRWRNIYGQTLSLTSYATVGSIVATDPGSDYYAYNNRIGNGLAVVGTTRLFGSVGLGTDAITSGTIFTVDGNISQSNPDTGTGATLKTLVLSRNYSMTDSATDVLEFDNWGTAAFEITVFRRDNTSPAGAQVTKLYLAFHGSGTNITQASLAQDDKVIRGSIHGITYSISENNNTATLTATGDNTGGETQDLTFYILGRGHFSGSVTVL